MLFLLVETYLIDFLSHIAWRRSRSRRINVQEVLDEKKICMRMLLVIDLVLSSRKLDFLLREVRGGSGVNNMLCGKHEDAKISTQRSSVRRQRQSYFLQKIIFILSTETTGTTFSESGYTNESVLLSDSDSQHKDEDASHQRSLHGSWPSCISIGT